MHIILTQYPHINIYLDPYKKDIVPIPSSIYTHLLRKLYKQKKSS